MHLSSPPDAIKLLSGEILTDFILYLLIYKFANNFSSPIEYIFITLSFPPDTKNFPLEEKLIDFTGAEWIFIKWLNAWILFFQSLIVESLEHEAIKVPIGFIATSLIELLCPINLIGLALGFKLKTKIFPSSLPVITCFL